MPSVVVRFNDSKKWFIRRLPLIHFYDVSVRVKSKAGILGKDSKLSCFLLTLNSLRHSKLHMQLNCTRTIIMKIKLIEQTYEIVRVMK